MTVDDYDDIADDLINRVNNRSSQVQQGQEQTQEQTQQKYQDEDEQLAADPNNKLSESDIDFVINTIKKEAEHDELSIRQLFFGMASAFTKRPIHHIVNSKESGAGKNYLLELVSRYFPDKYVTPLGNMSDKALYHRRGILVITDPITGQEQPISPIITSLKTESDILENRIDEEKSKAANKRDKELIKKNQKRIREIEAEIKDIEGNAQKVIDLNNQILLCLDTPQSSLYDAIMSIVSQDTPKDQEYSFVDKTAAGKLLTKNNKIRGTPVIIPTQVIDDTRTERFAEKNRRFVNINPETSTEKIDAAKNIMALQGGYLPEEYDELVVSREDKDRAKYIVSILVAKLKQHSKALAPKEHGVKIPFALSIANAVPNTNVWGMTVNDRIIKYLSIIAKIHMDCRPRIQNIETGQFHPIATFADLKDALYLMQVAASGVRPYISWFYNHIFIEAIKDLDGKPNEEVSESGTTITKEKYVGVTTRQLAEKTKEKLGYKPSDNELRYKYLYPLENQGIINVEKSELDKRANIYMPVQEGNVFHLFDEANIGDNNNDLKLKISDPRTFPTKSFMRAQFRTIVKKNVSDGSVFLKKNILLDADGSEITLYKLTDKYYNNPEKCFINIHEEPEQMVIAVRNNVNYQYEILQKNFSEKHHSRRRSILTEIDNKEQEESSSNSNDKANGDYWKNGKWRKRLGTEGGSI